MGFLGFQSLQATQRRKKMRDNDHRPITVVIIDDDEIFRDGLEGVLREAMYRWS